MIKSSSKIFAAMLISASITTVSQASMADALIYNIAGQATNAIGARIGDEIYYGTSRKRTRTKKRRTKRRHKHKQRKKATAKKVHAPVMTDEKRIQKSLSSLGFYRGQIDGQVNSFETRSAIKKMNKAYNISRSASLKPEVKDTLIFLGTLFGFDKYLTSQSTNPRDKNKKIQVALKLHGFYHGGIDGAIGRGSRNSISQYKSANGMTPTGSLDFEEEYQLISSAKTKNDANIEDSISSLEAIGVPAQRENTQQYQRQDANQPVINHRQVSQPYSRGNNTNNQARQEGRQSTVNSQQVINPQTAVNPQTTANPQQVQSRATRTGN